MNSVKTLNHAVDLGMAKETRFENAADVAG